MTVRRKVPWLKLNRVAWGLLLAAFFWAFQGRTLKAHFGPDEMMNIYGYWHPPLWKVILSDLAFWTNFVRPMAAIYYLPLFHFFKLNPVPYTVVRMGLLALNTLLFYKFARNLTGSWWVAVLASFPVAYQANLGNLAFDGAFIFDVLCGTFFFAALLYYSRARRGRESLSLPQTCIFLALVIGALDSKEMGVSLAVVVFSYELLLRGHSGAPRELLKRFAPALAAGLLTLIYVVGKSTGNTSLTNIDAYRPVFTWTRFSESTVRFFNTMFYTDEITIQHAIAMWALLLCAGVAGLARSRRNPRWMFLWIWVMVTPLPIAFLPGRGAALLYIVAAGWAIALAMMFRSVASILACHLFAGRAGRFAVMTACLFFCAEQYGVATRAFHRYDVYAYLLTGKENADTIQRLKALHLRPKPGSRVVFLRDPTPDTYDMTFISSLLWNDRSLKIWQQSQAHFPDGTVAGMDYIIDYTGDRFVVVKQPPS